MFVINTVTLGGNLTRDPELRSTPNGTSVCKIRLAVNSRRKDGNGQWVDKPNYFDVTVWGKLGENVAQNLKKGAKLAVQGRLDWREWDATDGSGKRQSVDVIAEAVFYDRQGSGNGNGGSAPAPAPAATAVQDEAIPFA